jgi:hypothetical protein
MVAKLMLTTLFCFSMSIIPAQAANVSAASAGSLCRWLCEMETDFGACMKNCPGWLPLAGPAVQSCLENACSNKISCTKAAVIRCGYPLKNKGNK